MDINIAKAVGQRLKEARNQKGITQEQAGKSIQMTQPNYARYERGVYELSYWQLYTLCKLFEVSADYLLCLSDY